MKKIIFSIIVAFAMVLGVNAAEKNEVTLNFKGGIIHDGYVEYSKVANVQVFKGDNLVVDISNNMVIDLNEAEYKFVIDEIEDETVGVTKPGAVRLRINNWYYPISTSIVEGTKPSFKLESSKFSGTLEVKFVRSSIAINTKVENIYNDISAKGVVDLTNGKEYVIDFSKNDELTEGLKSFADLEKTLYYKRVNDGLSITDNENEAVIKIVGNSEENKAILTAINVGNKKSEVFKGFHMQYTGSALDYNSTSDGIIYETRFDYYTRCTYEFTFKYVEDIPEVKEYQVIEGANQKYTIDKDSDMTFKVDADYSLFDKKVYIDEILVDVNNYTSKEGSTIIIFNKDYVSKLNVGKHTLKVVFSDNNEALTNFEIVKEEKIEVKEYQVIEGANQKYTIDKDSDMTFKVDAEYSLFDKKVYIDEKLVDVNNYTSKEGSTIIIFNKDYVSKLSLGKHTLKVIFSDNNEAITNFEIVKEEKIEVIENPSTMDNIEKYIAMGIVAAIGIDGSIVLIRKNKEK